MDTRRRVLALLGSGLTTVPGCLRAGENTTRSPTQSPSESPTSESPTSGPTSTRPPTDTDTQTPTDAAEATEPADTERPTDALADAEPWEPAWTMETSADRIWFCTGGDRLYIALDDRDDEQVTFAALRYGEQTLRWRRAFEGRPTGTALNPTADSLAWGVVVVADGTAYCVHGRPDDYAWTTLRALDAATGESRWSFRRERDIEGAGVLDDTVVAYGEEFFEPEHPHDAPDEPLETVLYGLDAATGEEQWSRSFAGVEGVIVGEAGPVVVTDDGVTGLAADGSEQWSISPSADLQSLATVGDRTVVAVGDEREDVTVTAYDHDGEAVWERSLLIGILYPHGDRVYGFGRETFALTADGEVAWRARGAGEEPLISPAGDRLYNTSRAGDAVQGYDITAGRRLFRFDPSTDHIKPVAATDDAAVAKVSHHDKFHLTGLYAIDATTGDALAGYRPDADVAGVASTADTVYVGSWDGTLAAFETGGL